MWDGRRHDDQRKGLSPSVDKVDGVLSGQAGLLWFTCIYSISSGGSVVKNPPVMQGPQEIPGFDPWVGKIPLEEGMATHSMEWSGESHGQRSQADYSPQGRKELDMTEVT